MIIICNSCVYKAGMVRFRCETCMQPQELCRRATLGHIDTLTIWVQNAFFKTQIVIFLPPYYVPDIILNCHIYMNYFMSFFLLFHKTCVGSALLLCCAYRWFHRWSTPGLDSCWEWPSSLWSILFLCGTGEEFWEIDIT